MRLGISNIAWDVIEDEPVADLLQRYRVDAIDIAPGKYFPKPAEALASDILKVKQWWLDQGIEITGMQSLLFGATGLNVFGSAESQEAMLAYLGAVCRIGGILGATRLVFGSPKNRDRNGLDDDKALDVAIEFFKRLGDRAQTEGVIVCLEPNPTCYGANFMLTSEETARVVRAVDHPAIRMQIDLGAITINKESIHSILSACADLVGHVHASEPNLAPLGDRGSDHASFASGLVRYLPKALVTIEMTATHHESHLNSIERSLNVADKNYRCGDLRSMP